MASIPKNSTAFSPVKAHPIRGYLSIAAATFCWAISATLGRAAFTGRLFGAGKALAPIDPLIIAQSRTTLSLFILAPVLFALRGREGMRISRRDFWRAMVVGVAGVAGSNYFYYLAIQRTNVATAIILQYTAPVWVLAYMVARKLQNLTAQRVISSLLALFGIALVINIFGVSSHHLDKLGVIAAMLASLAFAQYNVAGASLVQRHDRWKILFYLFLGAAVFWAIVNPPWKVAAMHYSGAQWLFLWVFAITSILVPFSLYFWGLQNLDPTRAIVTSCLEPVFSILVAAAVLGEGIGGIQALGILVVLSATLLIQMPDRKSRPAVVIEPME